MGSLTSSDLPSRSLSRSMGCSGFVVLPLRFLCRHVKVGMEPVPRRFSTTRNDSGDESERDRTRNIADSYGSRLTPTAIGSLGGQRHVRPRTAVGTRLLNRGDAVVRVPADSRLLALRTLKRMHDHGRQALVAVCPVTSGSGTDCATVSSSAVAVTVSSS